jgi:hypothetical protein
MNRTNSDSAMPLDMILFCPNCFAQHVDEARPDVCESCGLSENKCDCVVFTEWLNPPHKSHRCQRCNHVWRPSDVPTNGVKEIKTAGRCDSFAVPMLMAPMWKPAGEPVERARRAQVKVDVME